MIDWERDLMPEHIWIDLLAQEYKNLNWSKIYNDFLDKLEECVGGEICLYGMISDFGRIPEDAQEKFLEKHKDFAHYAFFKPVGTILTLYPECPAKWLILPEWKDKEEINFVGELTRLSHSLERLIKAKDDYAGHIRAIPLNRAFKHKKIFIRAGMPIIDLLPKYPGGCTEDERYRVQSFARTFMNQILTNDGPYKTGKWAKYFWRQNYNLVPCRPLSTSLEKGNTTVYDETIKDIQQTLWQNCTILIKYLDKIAMQYKYDLYDPIKDEIKLGLFSRIVRLFISFVSNPFLWTRDMSGIMLRCLGDTAIVFFHMVLKGTDEDFNNFRSYALGKEKLLMLHLQDAFKNQVSLESKRSEDIAQDIGGGFQAEILDIELHNWIKKDGRQMARDAGLEDIYKLIIDPASSEIHGSWTSIRKSNLVICTQILHRYHKMPKFFEPPIFLMSIYVAERIYERCLKLGKEKLGFPEPDEQLKKVRHIEEAVKQVSDITANNQA